MAVIEALERSSAISMLEDARYELSKFRSSTLRLPIIVIAPVYGVDRVNGMERACLFTHVRLAQLAIAAPDAISLRDLPGLRRVVAESNAENKPIHPSKANALIDGMIGGNRLRVA